MERDQYSISSLIIEKFTEKNKSSVRVYMGKREIFFFKSKIKDEPFWEEHDNEKACWNQKHVDHYACTDDRILQRN